MARILREELGYDNDLANNTVTAMIDSGVLRYHRTQLRAEPIDLPAERTRETDETPEAGFIPVVPLGGGSSTGVSSAMTPMGATPVIVGSTEGPGYWQIGRDRANEPGEGHGAGRAGQVDPTA